MPPCRLLLGVVAPIVAVAVAVNDHVNVNVNGGPRERKMHLNRKGDAGALGASSLHLASPQGPHVALDIVRTWLDRRWDLSDGRTSG